VDWQDETRTCATCGVEKKNTEFCSVPTSKKRSKSVPCRDCRHHLSYMRRRKEGAPRRFASQLLRSMKGRCLDKGWPPPEFSREDILSVLDRGVCQRTGIPFDLTDAEGRTNPYAPSPDRIDSSQGYTKSNTQFVCLIYNYMKSDYPQNVVDKFISALVAKHQSP